ncbi:hypothetical protein GOV05_01425 [Candidatus Woesearchaeota archaeon]|nr:hypothetical protein [Candidatus Woesearchaeota archaeon]
MKLFINNKKGFQAGVLVAVILVIISAAVLFGVFQRYGKILGSAEDKSCSFSLMLSSMTKIGGKVTIPPECEHKIHTITGENISANTQRARQTVASQQELGGRTSEYLSYYGAGHSDEWYINEFMAKELRKCWDMAGAGTYDLFDEWWSFFDCSKPGQAAHSCDGPESAWEKLNTSYTNKGKLPTFCILCSSVRFGVGVDKKEINSLIPWIENNPVPKTKTSYAEYLTANSFIGNTGQNYQEYDTNEPQAVIYVKVQKTGLSQLLTNLGRWTNYIASIGDVDEEEEEKLENQKYIQYTGIVDYNDLYDTCSYLIG